MAAQVQAGQPVFDGHGLQAFIELRVFYRDRGQIRDGPQKTQIIGRKLLRQGTVHTQDPQCFLPTIKGWRSMNGWALVFDVHLINVKAEIRPHVLDQERMHGLDDKLVKNIPFLALRLTCICLFAMRRSLIHRWWSGTNTGSR